MGQDLLLDLARIDVGAAGNVHVRGAAGDVDEALRVHVAEVAGAEPAIAERLRVGLRVVAVAGEDRRADDADLAGLAGADRARPPRPGSRPRMPVRSKPQEPIRVGPIVGRVLGGRQDGDVAGDLAQAEILHEDRTELLQRLLLVGAVHRRPGIDDVAQRGMVETVDRRVLDQQLQDGRHGEQRSSPAISRPAARRRRTSKRSVGSSTVFTPRATCASWWMPAPCDSGATTSEASSLGRAGHQVAQVIGDDEAPSGHASAPPPSGRPVVPEVKKNQHGSSRSTTAIGTVRPALRGDDGIVVLAEFGVADGDEEATLGACSRTACACPGKARRRSCRRRRWPSPDRRPRRATGGSWSGPRPRRCESRRTWIRTSGCCWPTGPAPGRPSERRIPSSSACAKASTRACIAAQVHVSSRQTKPISSGCRRADCARKFARFIARVVTGLIG